MAHAQKPDFVFPRNGRVHLNRWGRQFSRLLAAEVCASAWVMLDRPRSEVAWEYWLPTPFASFPFTSPPVRHRVPPGSERALQDYRTACGMAFWGCSCLFRLVEKEFGSVGLCTFIQAWTCFTILAMVTVIVVRSMMSVFRIGYHSHCISIELSHRTCSYVNCVLLRHCDAEVSRVGATEVYRRVEI